VLLITGIPATSSQPIRSGCVVNSDDVMAVTSAIFWSYPRANTMAKSCRQNPPHFTRSIFSFLIANDRQSINTE